MNNHVNLFGDSEENLTKLVKKYCLLVTKTDLSSEDAKIITEILDYSVYDEGLNYWLSEADQIIDYQLSTGLIPDYDLVISSLSIKNLVHNLTRDPSDKVTDRVRFETFKKLVKQTELKGKFLEKYKSFSNKSFSRKAIFQTKISFKNTEKDLTIYMIGWKPGQTTHTVHHHGQSLDAIQVYQGEMTHWFVDQRLEPEEVISTPGDIITKNEFVCIKRKQHHFIANNSSQELVTLHFRFGAPPDNDNWVKLPDECKPEAMWSDSNEDMEGVCRLMTSSP